MFPKKRKAKWKQMPAKSGQSEKFKNPMKASTPTNRIQLETASNGTATTTSISTTSRWKREHWLCSWMDHSPCHSLSSPCHFLSPPINNVISLRTAAHQKRKWVLCASHPSTYSSPDTETATATAMAIERKVLFWHSTRKASQRWRVHWT